MTKVVVPTSTLYQGPPGPPGESFNVDESGPKAARPPFVGPLVFPRSYLADDTGELSIKGDTAWGPWIPFRGAPGPQGPQGIPGQNGTNGTNGSQGPIGDTGADAYEVWIAAGNSGTREDYLLSLIGPPGPEGPPGLDGIDGIDGIDGTDGIDGIDGAQGLQGVQGPAGPKGDRGDPGVSGQSFVPDATGSWDNRDAYDDQDAGFTYWIQDLGDPNHDKLTYKITNAHADWAQPYPRGVQGPAGPQGPAGSPGTPGAPGARGLTGDPGPQGPAGSQGVKGDKGDPGTPGVQGPAGAQGPQGVAGTNGKTVHNGAIAPAAGVGVDGDFYINTSGDKTVHGPKAAGAWPGGTSMRGAQGIQGIQGPTGVAGPAGPTGPEGPQGAAGTTDHFGLTNVSPAVDGSSPDSNKHISNLDFRAFTRKSQWICSSRIATLNVDNASWTTVAGIITNMQNPYGWAGAGNNLVTVPFDGLYLLSMDGAWTANTAGDRISAYLLDTGVRVGVHRKGGTGGANEFTNVTHAYLTAGQTVTFQVYHNAGAAITLQVLAGCRVSMMLLSVG